MMGKPLVRQSKTQLALIETDWLTDLKYTTSKTYAVWNFSSAFKWKYVPLIACQIVKDYTSSGLDYVTKTIRWQILSFKKSICLTSSVQVVESEILVLYVCNIGSPMWCKYICIACFCLHIYRRLGCCCGTKNNAITLWYLSRDKIAQLRQTDITY